MFAFDVREHRDRFLRKRSFEVMAFGHSPKRFEISRHEQNQLRCR